MKIALTGATGTVGRFVCAYLQSQGHTVRALVRPESERAGFDVPPTYISGVMDDPAALSDLLAGVDGVVHCAFSHVPGRYRGGEGDDVAKFWRENFGATAALLRTAREQDVARVVLMSSRAVFAHRATGEDVHSSVGDDYPCRPDTQYGALKAAEEALASAAMDMQVCALRPTGVYGLGYPTASSKWFDLTRDVLSGKPVTLERTSTEVHGMDVGAAVTLLLQAPAEQVSGLGFNCSDITITTRELVTLIAQAANVDCQPPGEAGAVRNPMRCDRLTALGWQPGGRALLLNSLDELITAVRSSL